MNDANFEKTFATLLPDENGCLNWPKAKPTSCNHAGAAYRHSYRKFKGQITDDKPVICHTCDNGRCVNPEHLIAETFKYNMEDMVSKGRNKPGRYDKKGVNHPSALLFDHQVMEIREKYATGKYAMQELCEEYGLSAVSMIIKGKTWAHLPLVPFNFVPGNSKTRNKMIVTDNHISSQSHISSK